MESIEDFERKKEILMKNRDSATQRLKEAKEKYEQIKNDNSIDMKEKRLEIALNSLKLKEKALQQIEDKLEFLRPSNQEDIDYRQKQYDEFPELVKNTIPDDLHLCFHGCPISAAKHIIEDGEISSSVDRIGIETSYDVADQVSVTTKETIETTVRGYSDLTGNFNLPAGCIFAILPKDENDIKTSRDSMLIGNVSFKETPERLHAIITTPENIETISKWAKDAGINLSKIYDYDGFIKEMEKSQQPKNEEQLTSYTVTENKDENTLFSEKEIGKATVNITTEEKDKTKEQINGEILKQAKENKDIEN